LEDLSVLSQFKKYHPSGNLKFNYLDILQSLKLHILMEKILSVSLKLNFTPNTFGGYGLNRVMIRLDWLGYPRLERALLVEIVLYWVWLRSLRRKTIKTKGVFQKSAKRKGTFEKSTAMYKSSS